MVNINSYFKSKKYEIAQITKKGLIPIKQFSSSLENYKWTNFLATPNEKTHS